MFLRKNDHSIVKNKNIIYMDIGQEALYYRANCNSLATQGKAEDMMNATL